MVDYNRAYERLGVASNFDSRHALVTSPVLSPLVLAAIRLLLAFYTLFTNIFIFVWNGVRLGVGAGCVALFSNSSCLSIGGYLI
jgi:hypothetical protein